MDIRNQFFIESFAITAAGGLLGIVMGLAIAKGVAVYAGWKTIVTVWSILLSVGVSAAVGLVFGIYPADARGPPRPDRVAALRVALAQELVHLESGRVSATAPALKWPWRPVFDCPFKPLKSSISMTLWD